MRRAPTLLFALGLLALAFGCGERDAPASASHVERRMPDPSWPAVGVAWEEPVPHRADVGVLSEHCAVEGARLRCALGVVNHGDKPVEISIHLALLDGEGHAIETIDAASDVAIGPGAGIVVTEARDVPQHARMELRGSIRAPEKS